MLSTPKIHYTSDGYRGVGRADVTRRYNFVIEGKADDLEKMLTTKRTEKLTFNQAGSQCGYVASENPCERCGPWNDYCRPADKLYYEPYTNNISGFMEARPYMLIFDRYVDSNPHIGYWNIQNADWEKWETEKNDRDISSIEGTVQKTDGLSAHSRKTISKIPENGREISDTKWFTFVDGGDFTGTLGGWQHSGWGCCLHREKRCNNIRIRRVEAPQMRNQQIGSKLYRRSRDFWFPIYFAGGSYGPFVGMISSENMDTELLDIFLKRVITSKRSSFNEY